MTFLKFEEAIPTSAWKKAQCLANAIRRKKVILILDGLEALQHLEGVKKGVIKDAAIVYLLQELSFDNCYSTIITSRIKLSDFPTNNKIDELNLPSLTTKEGSRLLRSKGIKNKISELAQISFYLKGHPLSITILASYAISIEKLYIENDIIDSSFRNKEVYHNIENLFDKYTTLLQKNNSLQVLQIISLFDRPLDTNFLIEITHATVKISKSALEEHLTYLKRNDLIYVNTNEVDAHPLTKQYFKNNFHKHYTESWVIANSYIFDALAKNKFPLHLSDIESLYFSIYFGCNSKRYQEAYQLYREVIHQNEKYYSLETFGTFSLDISALKNFITPQTGEPIQELSLEQKASIYSLLGYNYLALGSMQSSKENFEMALELRIQQNDFLNAAKNAGNLSELNTNLGNIKEAITIAEKGIKLALLSKSNFITESLYTLKAYALFLNNQKTEAKKYFDLALKSQKKSLPATPYLTGKRGFRYNLYLIDCKEYSYVEEASNYLLNEAKNSHSSLDTAQSLLTLAIVKSKLSDDSILINDLFDEALIHFRESGRFEQIPRAIIEKIEYNIHVNNLIVAENDLRKLTDSIKNNGMLTYEIDLEFMSLKYNKKQNRLESKNNKRNINQLLTKIEVTGYKVKAQEIQDLLL